jgi:hypothetical protein
VPAAALDMCDQSQLGNLNLDGDDKLDSLVVFSPAPNCRSSSQVGDAYESMIILGSGDQYHQTLSECEEAFACQALAAPDLDGDGRLEIAITLNQGASVTFFALYRFDPGSGLLNRLVLQPPGDGAIATFPLEPGPSKFLLGGSVNHIHAFTCAMAPQAGELTASTAMRSPTNPERYQVHEASLQLTGTSLQLTGTKNYTASAGEEGLEAVLNAATSGSLCGGPIADS